MSRQQNLAAAVSISASVVMSMQEIRQTPQSQVQSVLIVPKSQFVPALAAWAKRIINLLDETERVKRLPPTRFDTPVQERVRKAS